MNERGTAAADLPPRVTSFVESIGSNAAGRAARDRAREEKRLGVSSQGTLGLVLNRLSCARARPYAGFSRRDASKASIVLVVSPSRA